MNDVVRQNPWSLMPRLQDEINRLFGNMTENDSSSATAAWVPPVDIHEYGDRFEIYVDLPGEGGILTLSGQRTNELADNRSNDIQYRRTERSQGRFYRRFVLPDTA